MRPELDLAPDRSGKTPFAQRAAAAYFGTLAVLFALLLAACALPGGPVRASVCRSVETLRQEGLYPAFFGFKLFQMDNYTDTIMLFEAAAADETDPLTAMMVSTAYNVDNFETLHEDLCRYLEKDLAIGAQHADAPALTPFSYARYWHGYLIWLRPLLALGIPYAGVRVFQYLVLGVLLAAVLWLLQRRCGRRAAVWFLLSQLAVAVFFVPHQVQFFTTFAIAYAACIWVLLRPRDTASLCAGLVAVGTATAFCDLLVTPILTLGLPMACWLLMPRQHLRACPRQCAAVAAGSLCWGGGYGLCWASKWILATLLTGQDVIGDAVRQAGVRTSADTWRGMELTWGNIFRFLFDTLNSRGLFWPLLFLLVLALGAFVLCLRSKAALLRALPLGLTALMAPVWFCVLRTHSIQHGWFTWRALAPTLFAGMAFVYYTCSLKMGLRRLRACLTRKGGTGQ